MATESDDRRLTSIGSTCWQQLAAHGRLGARHDLFISATATSMRTGWITAPRGAPNTAPALRQIEPRQCRRSKQWLDRVEGRRSGKACRHHNDATQQRHPPRYRSIGRAISVSIAPERQGRAQGRGHCPSGETAGGSSVAVAAHAATSAVARALPPTCNCITALHAASAEPYVPQTIFPGYRLMYLARSHSRTWLQAIAIQTACHHSAAPVSSEAS